MGQDTKIEWADHTWNPWWGCENVSPACAHCYAEKWAKRFGVEWGGESERRFFHDGHWQQPERWNRAATCKSCGKGVGDGAHGSMATPRVFCGSMCDVFEDRDDLTEHRERLFDLIERTPHLIWMLLTKRPENVFGMVPCGWDTLWPAHVWIGTTVEDQKRAEERIPHLLQIPAPVRFLSCEPLLGPVDLRLVWMLLTKRQLMRQGKIDWVIAGGESGPRARPSHPDWFRSLRDQCQAAGVPFFFKQWGEWARIDPTEWHRERDGEPLIYATGKRDKFGTGFVSRVGKKAAGRLLDGREWDEIPEESKCAAGRSCLVPDS